MPEVTLAGEVKDWVTSVAIIVGGVWALWRFGYGDWLRRRAEIQALKATRARRKFLLSVTTVSQSVSVLVGATWVLDRCILTTSVVSSRSTDLQVTLAISSIRDNGEGR